MASQAEYDDLSDVVIPDRPCPPARHSLDEWEREAQDLDYLKLEIRARRRNAARARWEARTDRWGGRDVVLYLAHADGADLDEIAGVLGATPEEVAAVLTDEAAFIPQVLAILRTWKAHPDWTAGQIAQECGTSRAVVIHQVTQLGGTINSVEKRRAGGGYKHGPEVYEAIRKLREAGRTYEQIGEAVGLGWATVARMCHRKGYRKGGS